jgi:hypothetical protein
VGAHAFPIPYGNGHQARSRSLRRALA